MVDLRTASRGALLAVIARQQRAILALQRTSAEQRAEIARLARTVADQQATIGRLEARLRDLEAGGGKGSRGEMPGHKASEATEPDPGRARKRRPRGSGRKRGEPTDAVVHALAQCPACGTALEGGTPKWSRQVLEVEPSPVQVVEHVFVKRTCPRCRRRCTPPAAELGGAVVGRQRLGIGLVSLIATLREVGRLPVRTIQWHLQQVHGLRLSVGALVAASRTVAARGAGAVGAIRAQIRAGPLAHGDETGWRENGRNGYVWTFSNPTAVLFLYGRRAREMVDEALGEHFSGVLVCDFYAAYHHCDGLKQRCWAHLLREIHALRLAHPRDEALGTWAASVHAIYAEAVAFKQPEARERVRATRRFEERLLEVCRPFLEHKAAPQRALCARIARHSSELFVFVAHPEVPPDNNAAERSPRHLVTGRKISGGTRSPAGTATKMTNSSLFATWRLQDLDPLLACRQLLAQPQT